MGNLYYGDNLDVLRNHIPDESVDLIYLDPPFNSKADYNVLFREPGGSPSEAQITAFGDTWHWTGETQRTFDEIVREAPAHMVEMVKAFRQAIGLNDMMAYLTMMAARLLELRRVLKPTGSIYLHCDPTASHYLKIILDAVFGSKNFRNEIVWMRTTSKALMTRRLPSNHDVILRYSKSDEFYWKENAIFRPYDPLNLDEKTAKKYTFRDSDGRLYRLDNLINPNPDRPNLTYEFLGITKVWRWTKERMQAAYEAGLIVQPRLGSVPSFKRYLDEQRGKPLGDVWTDIPPINSQAQERLGYPTQKPETLLKRIIEVSSNEGDVVLDPFCGCGTAVTVAQRLRRNWIGIDVTHLAINLIKSRLYDMFRLEPKKDYRVVGEPEDLAGARELASQNRHQFQWWALSLIKARPYGDKKKGPDKGIDGYLYFAEQRDKVQKAIVQVKSGSASVKDVRELGFVVERENSEIGVLITLEYPTKSMIAEAASRGYYRSTTWNREYPRIQILTIEQLLAGKAPHLPPTLAYQKQAPKTRTDEQLQIQY